MTEPKHISEVLGSYIGERRGTDAPRSPLPPRDDHVRRPRLADAADRTTWQTATRRRLPARRPQRHHRPRAARRSVRPDGPTRTSRSRPGHPAHQVLDIDDLEKTPEAVIAVAQKAPRVATARVGHAYFNGTDAATVVLEYGDCAASGPT